MHEKIPVNRNSVNLLSTSMIWLGIRKNITDRNNNQPTLLYAKTPSDIIKY